MLVETGGELTPEVEYYIAKLEGTLEERGQWLIKSCVEADAQAQAAKTEAKRLADLSTYKSKKATTYKQILKSLMYAVGIKKLKTPSGDASIVGNGGTQKIEWIGDLEKVPAQFIKYTPSIDYDSVYSALNSGGIPTVPDTESGHGFLVHPRGDHLRIK